MPLAPSARRVLDFLEVRPLQPGPPGLGKLLLRPFAGRGTANARALVGIDEHAGDRPAPTLAGRAANLLFERANDGAPAYHDKIVVTRLPASAGY